MEYITNEEYRKRDGVSSSVLKKLLISDAHYQYVLDHGWPHTDATTLGDAIHAYFLEPERFNGMYTKEVEVYKRATGDFKAGDPKLDEEGNPLTQLTHCSDSSMNIKGEQYKKFVEMVEAVNNCPEAMLIFKNKENVEASFFGQYMGMPIKVRCDCMYRDVNGKLWVVDIKTVGGTKECPSSPQNFAFDMFDKGYDLQAYMYVELIRETYPDVVGFKFICIDAKCPSGVKIYDIVRGESEWYELGGYRFSDAMYRYNRFCRMDTHRKYDKINDTVELSFNAADALTVYRQGEK